MPTLPFRDVLFILMVVFNAGGLIWSMRTMYLTNNKEFRKVDGELANIFGRLTDLEKGQARIEGKLE